MYIIHATYQHTSQSHLFIIWIIRTWWCCCQAVEKTSFECSKHHLAAAVLHLGPPLKYVTSTSSSLSSALPLVNHLQISNLRSHGNLSSSRLSWTDGILNLQAILKQWIQSLQNEKNNCYNTYCKPIRFESCPAACRAAWVIRPPAPVWSVVNCTSRSVL